MTAPHFCVVPPPMMLTARDPCTVEQLMARLIKSYGKTRVSRMLRDFKAGRSTKSIALRLGVDQRRIEAWRAMLGSTITCYVVHDEVQRIADEESA